jgi:hypothetical protein
MDKIIGHREVDLNYWLKSHRQNIELKFGENHDERKQNKSFLIE